MKIPDSIKTFIRDMLCDNGVPSSARVLSFILSIWSMGLIAWSVRHTMALRDGELQTWVSGLPMIIGALTAFAAWPYAISKGGSSLSDIFRRKSDDVIDARGSNGGKG